MADTWRAARRVDVRLAVVCYGGVSLAIYMFGTICEFRSLLTAARAFDAFCDLKSDPRLILKGTEKVYYDILKEIRHRHGIELHVILDFVSGTSAGGINGVALATSARHGTSLMPFYRTLLDELDLKVLTGSRFVTLFSYIVSLTKLSSSWKIESLPWYFKAMGSWMIYYNQPIFDSKKILQLIQEQLRQLIRKEPSPSNTSVLGKADSLSLFVTMTDLHPFPHNLTIGLNQEMESMYNKVMRFDYRGESPVDDFQDDKRLAFAARATSAFPFAFQGIQIAQMFSKEEAEAFEQEHFRDVVLENIPSSKPAPRNWGESLRSWGESLMSVPMSVLCQVPVLNRMPPFRRRQAPPDAAATNLPLENHEFADGGLMMNKPFAPLLRAMKGRRKTFGNNIQRRVMYLEPSPEPGRKRDVAKTGSQEPLGKESQGTHESESGFGDGLDIMGRDASTFGAYAELMKIRKSGAECDAFDITRSPELNGWRKRAEHLTKVFWAITSQPISDQISEVERLNDEQQRLHRIMIREYIHTLLVVPDLVPKNWNGRTLALSDFYQGIPYDVQKQHMEARTDDASRSLAEALAGRCWLYLPDGSFQEATLRTMLVQLWDKIQPVVTNPFFFRDCLAALVCVLENHSMNPIVFTANDEERVEKAQQISNRIQLTLSRFDKMVSGRDERAKRIKKGDDFVKVKKYSSFRIARNPNEEESDTQEFKVREEDIRKILQDYPIKDGRFVEQPDGLENVVRKLNQIAKFAFERLREWARWTEDEIVKGLLPSILNEASLDQPLFKIIKEVIFGFGLFDALTFPMIYRIPLGDNTVTKVTRVSPDNMRLLFSATRQQIRNKGLTSIANVFVRSNDSAHFAGFFFDDARESDLIWGRLDGVEAVCNLLIDCAEEELCNAKKDFQIIEKDLRRHSSKPRNAKAASTGSDSSLFHGNVDAFPKVENDEKETMLDEVSVDFKQCERADTFLATMENHQGFLQKECLNIRAKDYEVFYYQGFAEVLEEEIRFRDPTQKQTMAIKPNAGSAQEPQTPSLKWKSPVNEHFFKALLTKHPGIRDAKSLMGAQRDGGPGINVSPG